MKEMYFNEFECKDALDYIDKNPAVAKVKLEDYLKKYPTDFSTYPYYISCLITLGEFEEAEKYLNYLKKAIHTNDKFNNQLRKVKLLKHNIIFNYLKLFSYEHKYNKLYKLCMENYSTITKLKLTSLVFYCRKKLNMLNQESREGNAYLYRQILDYKEDDLLEHIKRHLSEFNKDLDEPNPCIFSVDFPLHKVLEAIKECIPSTDKRLLTGFYEDAYIFKYDYCGKVSNKVTNYFKVVCFNDTNNIITMYPSLNCEELPCIDLNYLKTTAETKNSKVKKLSQIDKFNQKYNLK